MSLICVCKSARYVHERLSSLLSRTRLHVMVSRQMKPATINHPDASIQKFNEISSKWWSECRILGSSLGIYRCPSNNNNLCWTNWPPLPMLKIIIIIPTYFQFSNLQLCIYYSHEKSAPKIGTEKSDISRKDSFAALSPVCDRKDCKNSHWIALIKILFSASVWVCSRVRNGFAPIVCFVLVSNETFRN